MTTPRIHPKTRKRPSRSFQPEIPRSMKIDDATISPKKNAQVCIGWLERRYCMRPASATTLTPIPAANATRKFPLMCFQNLRISPLNSSFSASAFIEAMDPTNSSYMPMMNAIVPPDTPGMTSAAPIHAPFMAIVI